VECLPPRAPEAAVGRMATVSAGKDTLIGHWELMGQVTPMPFPTYPNGFPDQLIAELADTCGRAVIGNRPASGTQIIDELGPRQLETGELIVYTSADSVLQIAAHESVVAPEELYRYCRIARRICSGEHAVARIIARPFIGAPGAFVRTQRRRDFPLPPPKPLLLDILAANSIGIAAVGKIAQIYSGRGIRSQVHTADNEAGQQVILDLWEAAADDLVFANLVDFDTLYGHRNDVSGYAAALAEFDEWLGGFIPRLGEDEAVIITADHGCDPTTPSTDHSREYVPVLIYGPRIRPRNIGTIEGLSFVGQAVCALLGLKYGAGGVDARELLRDGIA
jgi:phosphopentomutase